MRAIRTSFALLVVLAGCAFEDTGTSTTGKGGTTSGGTTGGGSSTGTGGSTTAPDPGSSLGTETWSDGKTLSGNVTIAEGATVTIAPGATITVADGVAITVKGTLVVDAAASHATITGGSWVGLVIAAGGRLDAKGLELTKAQSALWTQTGNAGAAFTDGVIAAKVPFKMEAGSTLSVTRASVTATGQSAIAGTFIASYLVYDKGSAEGLELDDPAGTMTITDSTLKGAGSGDYVVSSHGHLVQVAYTTISGAHCGLHFDSVDRYVVDHVSDDTNSYGAMLYGSGAGPNTITSSNFRNLSKDLDMLGTNGPLTVSDSLTGGKNNLQGNATIVGARTVAVPDAKPR